MIVRIINSMLMVIFISGCITHTPTSRLDRGPKTAALGYQTIHFQGIEIQYRNLSTTHHSQHIPSSLDHRSPNSNTPLNSLVNHDASKAVKLTFAKNRSNRFESSTQLNALTALASYKALSVQYQVQASAGGISSSAIKLANKRAAYIKDQLLKQGVPESKIHQVAYDPNQQGQQGWVWLRPLSVEEQLIHTPTVSNPQKVKRIKLKRFYNEDSSDA